MSQFMKNPTDFAADCQQHDGQCPVARESVQFLDDGDEVAAVRHLQAKCGYVVIIPAADRSEALLYHTSCQRMTDAVVQVFQDRIGPPVSLPQGPSEMTLGELQRRRVTLSYDDCRARVDAFAF